MHSPRSENSGKKRKSSSSSTSLEREVTFPTASDEADSVVDTEVKSVVSASSSWGKIRASLAGIASSYEFWRRTGKSFATHSSAEVDICNSLPSTVNDWAETKTTGFGGSLGWSHSPRYRCDSKEPSSIGEEGGGGGGGEADFSGSSSVGSSVQFEVAPFYPFHGLFSRWPSHENTFVSITPNVESGQRTEIYRCNVEADPSVSGKEASSRTVSSSLESEKENENENEIDMDKLENSLEETTTLESSLTSK